MRTYNSVKMTGDGRSALVYRGKRQRFIGRLERTALGWHDSSYHPTNYACRHYRSIEDAIAALGR